MISLDTWGFQSFFTKPLQSGEALGRVVEEQKANYRVVTAEGIVAAVLAGKLRLPSLNRLERPVVGDWVVIRPLEGERKVVIQGVLPRKSLLRRKAAGETEAIQPLAANVELAVVVTSLNREFNEKRLQRYLTVAKESGSRAAILLTKSDLAPESAEQAALLAKKYHVPCIALCALSGEGLLAVKKLWIPGETAVFVGSSGVGKSTLVNALLGRQEQETAEIRETDDRGRHTTTSRRLIPLENGALVIDTPGLREIQLEAGQEEGLSLSFGEIERLSADCKFTNCRHETEPGCAVKAGIQRGELEQADYESYLKLRREIASQGNKQKRPIRKQPRRKER